VVGRRIAAALSLVALTALAAGCGASVLDTKQVNDQIAAQIEQQTGAEVASVACPSDVEAKDGGTFTCTVTGTDRSKASLTVVQKSGDGDLSFDAPLLHTTEAELAIAKDIGGGAQLDCPEVVLVEAGKTFECTLSGSGSGTVTVTLKDRKGNFDYEVNT
jgi:hypothetical protein